MPGMLRGAFLKSSLLILISLSEAVESHFADNLFFSIPGTSDSSRLLVEKGLRSGLRVTGGLGTPPLSSSHWCSWRGSKRERTVGAAWLVVAHQLRRATSGSYR